MCPCRELTNRTMEYDRKPRHRFLTKRIYYMIEVTSKVSGENTNYLENGVKTKKRHISHFRHYIKIKLQINKRCKWQRQNYKMIKVEVGDNFCYFRIRGGFLEKDSKLQAISRKTDEIT